MEEPVSADNTKVDSYDKESLIEDIECLMAQIESLQDHASAHQCLRETQLELIEKRKLLASL
jgi:ribosomal protein S15P/S13E